MCLFVCGFTSSSCSSSCPLQKSEKSEKCEKCVCLCVCLRQLLVLLLAPSKEKSKRTKRYASLHCTTADMLLLLLRTVPTLVLALVFSSAVLVFAAEDFTCEQDVRCLGNGDTIANMSFGYADQPYCAVVDKGEWVCTVTHNALPEGHPGEKVYTTRSMDKGNSWTPLIPLEPHDAPITEYAYSTILASNVNPQLLFQVYVENDQNVSSMPDGTKIIRTDMLGHFFLRWTLDAGKTWSNDRILVPVRKTHIDYYNDWKGKVQVMWLVDKGFVNTETGEAYIAFAKIGRYCVNPPTSSWVLYSPNLGNVTSATEITWKTLPEGDDGVHNWEWNDPATMGISEEPHIVPLAAIPNHVYMVFRTDDGFLGARSSVDNGNTWYLLRSITSDDGVEQGSKSALYLSNEEGQNVTARDQKLKNPRGPTQTRLVSNAYLKSMKFVTNEENAYLLLWYFNGHTSYNNRNVYWLSAGFASEDGTQVLWTDPEIALYTPSVENPRIGYPDYILDPTNGVYITETDKEYARSHHVDDSLLKGLFNMRTINAIPEGPSYEGHAPQTMDLPLLPILKTGRAAGFAMTFLFTNVQKTLSTEAMKDDGRLVFTNRDSGAGMDVYYYSNVLAVELFDAQGKQTANLTSAGCAADDAKQGSSSRINSFFGVVVDGGAQVLSLFQDGRLCDGGTKQLQGWTMLPSGGDYNGLKTGTLSNPARGGASLESMHLYTRVLRTSELVGNWRAVKN